MRVAMAKKQATKSSGPKKKKARPQPNKARRSSGGGFGDQRLRAHSSVAFSGRRQSGASVMFEEEAMVSLSSYESHSRPGGARASTTSSHNGGAAIQKGWSVQVDPGAIAQSHSPKLGAMSRSRMSQAESTTPSEVPSHKPWAGKVGKFKIVSQTEVVAKRWEKKMKVEAKGGVKGRKNEEDGTKAVIPSLFARDGTSALKRAVSYRQQQRRRSSNDGQLGSLAWFGARNVDAGQAPPGLSPDLVEKFVQYRRSEGQQHRQQSSGLFIRVDSNIRTFIDIISLTAVMYCTFMVPFDMVFTPEQTRSSMIADIIVEVFFLLEICVNFFTSYYDSDNNHITSNKLIALHYLKGWFVIDAAGSVPTEMAAQITLAQLDGQLDDVDGNLGTISNLKTIRVIRLFKLVRLLRVEALLGHLEFSLPLLSAVVGLLRLLLMISILSHLTACVWYYVATRNMYNSWVSKYHLGCCSPNQVEAPIDHGCETVEALPSISALYSEAMYWSITTISAVGYGDVLPCNPEEENMAVVAMVLGSALFAYVVGAISSVVSSSSSQDKKQHEKMMNLREYLNLRNIPADLARIIRVQCMHKWKNSVFSEEDILDEFMPQTRREVVEHILGEVVSQVAMFKYVDNSDFLTEVTLKFRPVATGNFDTPIQAFGDKGPDIFVVIRGHVNLLDEQGEVVGVAGKGTAIFENELISSLGEDESLDCPWKYCAPYSIVPSPNGEVFTLRRPDFINILRRYPKVRELYCQFKDDPLWEMDVENDLFLNDKDTLFERSPSSVNNEDLQASYAGSRMSVPPMIETSRVVGEGGAKVKMLLRSLKKQIDKRELLMVELKHLEGGGHTDDGGGFVMMHRTRSLPPLCIDGYPPMQPDRTASSHGSEGEAEKSGRRIHPRWKDKLTTERLTGDSSEFEADSATPRTYEGSHNLPASTRTSQSHSHDRRSSEMTSNSLDAREQRLSNGTQDSQHGLESAPHQSSNRNVHGPMSMLKRSSLLSDGGKQRDSPRALEQSNTPPTSVVSPSAVVSLLMPLNSP